MLILQPEEGVGGVQTRLFTLARTLAEHGGRATVLSAPGPLLGALAPHADVRVIDFDRLSDGQLQDLAATAVKGQDSAVVSCRPATLRAVPVLADQAPVLLGLHGIGDPDRFGFGMLGGRHIPQLLRSLVASGAVRLMADCARSANSYTRMLDLAPDCVAVCANGVPVPETPVPISHGAVRSIALMCRLARGKLVHVRGAIELTGAFLRVGRTVELQLYGTGPAQPLVERMLRRSLPERTWRLRGPLDSADDLVAHDVVVGTGRSSMEALVRGRRVVVVRTLPDAAGHLGAVVTPSTFDDLLDENFGVRRRAPLPPGEAVRQIEHLDADAQGVVHERARRELSARTMLQRHLTLLGAMPSRDAAQVRALDESAALMRRWSGGARRLPGALGVLDRGVVVLRGRRTRGW